MVYEELSDAELVDMSMYRCACGTAIYPNGDADWRHCALDVRDGDESNDAIWMSEQV